MLGRIFLLLGIHAVLGHLGRHHHNKAARVRAELLHVVQRTARLVNGTETEMSRCASALASAQVGLTEARNQMKEAQDQMNQIKKDVHSNEASINETARLEAVLSQHLHQVEAKVAQQSAKAEKLQVSITSFARKVEEDQAELARRKQTLFDRVAKLRTDQKELQHSEKEAEVTRLALKRMRNWKHISQDRVGWEEEKLETERRNHKRLRQSFSLEMGEVKKELNTIERMVQTWDTKRFLLADLMGHIKSTKKEIAKKRAAANEDKARLKDLGKLLEHRARERVQQMEKLKHAQAEYHDSLETVVKAQEEQLSEDKATIAKAQQAAADYASEVEDSERRAAEMALKRDEMLAKLTLQRENDLAKKDQEISELVSRLNQEAAARDAEVAQLRGSLDSLRPAYESRGDAIKIYEDIMVSQKQDLKKMRNAYDSTKSDLEQCLSSANHVDSAEAKRVLEAVEDTMAGQEGVQVGGPLSEIAGAIKNAMEQAVGPALGNSGKGIIAQGEGIIAQGEGITTDATLADEPTALTADFEKLMNKLKSGKVAKATTSSEGVQKPLQDQLAESWNHASSARAIKDRSVELPDALGEKVRALAAELHEVHFGMAGLAGALDTISNL